MNYNTIIEYKTSWRIPLRKKTSDTWTCTFSISCITKVQHTLESSNQQSYKPWIKVPCKHGFWVLNVGNTFDREASKVKLKNSNKADYF